MFLNKLEKWTWTVMLFTLNLSFLTMLKRMFNFCVG